MGGSQGETIKGIHSFIHSYNKRVASMCQVMCDDSRDTAVNKTHRALTFLTGLPAQ